MQSNDYAKIFTNGGSQAVRLPQEYRFAGDRVRIRKVGNAVILEPVAFDVGSWFEALDQFADVPFMESGRDQPSTPVQNVFEEN